MKKKRVFIGLTDVAGFGMRFKTGFQKIGHQADFYSFSKHIFGFNTDKIIKYSSNSIIRKFQKVFLLLKLVLKYDYFIFITPSTLLPKFKDIKLFKFFGKKTMLLYTGCDVRIPEVIDEYKWNPCRNCTQEYKDFVGCVIENKKKLLPATEKIFDIIGAPFEAGGYLKNYYDIFFPFEIDDLKNTSNNKVNEKFRILHAPSNETYKGTKYILEAIEKLKSEFDFEFILVKNSSYEDYLDELSKADLIIDQMLLGSYGSVAVEAMLLNKPVISYIRSDFLEKIKNDCPIINANPDTLYETLKGILRNPNGLKTNSLKGRAFVKKYHDDKVVAKRFIEFFENTNN